MKIGILQTGQAPDALKPDSGDYPEMFQRILAGYGLTFQNWHVENMEFPAGVHDAEGWLITGSRHGAYEDHPFIKPLEQFIRDAHAAGVPMVGICFGHQIMAQAMGGKVERFAGGWSVGPTAYDFGGETITLNAWHRDQVVEVPPGATVLAQNGACQVAALGYDDTMFSLQAHPEYPSDFIAGLMRTRGPGLVPEDTMAAARERLDTPLSAPSVAGRIAAFFKMPRARRDAA
jgi:GMP synthase-like glutamine amidotransferase